jgi:hypothetical protein
MARSLVAAGLEFLRSSSATPRSGNRFIFLFLYLGDYSIPGTWQAPQLTPSPTRPSVRLGKASVNKLHGGEPAHADRRCDRRRLMVLGPRWEFVVLGDASLALRIPDGWSAHRVTRTVVG